MFNVKVNNLNIQFTFRHIRDLNVPNVNASDATECQIRVNGQEFNAVALCSNKDKFDKEIGRKVALARALKAVREKIELPVHVRAAVWLRYFDRNVSNNVWDTQVHTPIVGMGGEINATGILDPEYNKVKA